MYGKIFDSMYEGTLYGHWEAIVTLQQMLVLCDSQGTIDMTPQAMAARTSIPIDILTKGIKILSEPDQYSRTPGEDGKRIVPLEDHRPWGWRIVNYLKYRNLKTREQKREADRARMADKRKAKKINDVAPSRIPSQSVADVAHADADTDAFILTWAEYPKRAGDNSRTKAEKAFKARIHEGHSPVDILAGVRRYAAYVKATGNEGTQFVKQAATFLGKEKYFLEPWTPPEERQPKTGAAW